MRDDDSLQDELDGEELADCQPVAYALDDEQAEQLRDLLTDYGIPALIEKDEYGGRLTTAKGIPVLVPVDSLDEAGDIIEQYENMDELAWDDETEDEEEEEDDDEEYIEQVDVADADLGDDEPPLGADDDVDVEEEDF